MSFAFAFGSFGDFVAVLQLAAAISTSLKAACSASAEINALALDIESFSLAIESARATIQRADSDTGHLPRSLDLALSHSLRTCSGILSKLQSKLKRMHVIPGKRKWSHIQRAAWMWVALGGRADVEALKRRLVEQVTAIQTLLTVLQSSAMNDIAQRGERDSLKLDRMLGLLEQGPSVIQREVPFQFFDIHGRAVAPLAKFDLNAFIRFSRTLPNGYTYSAASPPEVGRLAQLLVMTHPKGQAGTGLEFHCTAACKIFAFQDPAAFGETIILVSPVFAYRHKEEVDDGQGTCDHTSPLSGEQLNHTSSHGLLTAIRVLKKAAELDTTCGISASREQKLDALTNSFAFDLDDVVDRTRTQLIDSLSLIRDDRRARVVHDVVDRTRTQLIDSLSLIRDDRRASTTLAVAVSEVLPSMIPQLVAPNRMGKSLWKLLHGIMPYFKPDFVTQPRPD